MTQARLSTRDECDLKAETLQALEPVRVKGTLAPVYLQFANSEEAVRAYLTMENAIAQGSMSSRETECIKLLVSEITGCDYCLAVHSMKAAAVSIDTDTQLKVRAGERIGDGRIDAMLAIVRHFFESRGALSDELLASARAAQISDQTLVDLTMVVATIFYTNITNHINDSKTSLPAAPALPEPA